MKTKIIRIFLKLFVWIAPLNAFLTMILLFLHSWLKGVLQWAVIILNLPIILFVIVSKEYWEKYDVNWYVAIPLLTIASSLVWAWVIAFIYTAIKNKKEE